MFNRKNAKDKLAKFPSRKQTHYDVAEGDAVELTLYGTYENGTVKTFGGSYFIVSKFIADNDVVMKKLQPRKGKHA